MDLTSGIEKGSVGEQPLGQPGPPCLTCKEMCPGFQPHSWRKACTLCHCPLEDHAPPSDSEGDRRMGGLLTGSRHAHLTARVKGAPGGGRVYKRNRVIITLPLTSRKDPTFNTITYDWAPPGLAQKLAMRYLELVPEEKRPVAGTPGALHRRRQLVRQLPAHDQDPAHCHALSEPELRAMEALVKSYKEEALGVGEVALPGEGGAGLKNGKGPPDPQHPPTTTTTTTNGTDNSCKESEYCCHGCGGVVAGDSPVVYAERAGYSVQWHPSCFVCVACGEELVDLVYFWRDGALLCGRHYCQEARPRCSGCDELIFSEALHTAADGQAWHPDHYCCWRCGQSLDTPCSCSP